MATQGTESRTPRALRPPASTSAASTSEEVPGEPAPPPSKVRPIHVERIGNIRAAIWANDGGSTGVFFAVTASRLYKDGQNQWQSSDRFGRDDLLVLAKVLDRAHSWICDMMHAPSPPA